MASASAAAIALPDARCVLIVSSFKSFVHIDRLMTATKKHDRDNGKWSSQQIMLRQTALEFELDQQPRSLMGKVGEIERGRDADLTPGDLSLPRRADEHLGRDLPKEGRGEIDGVASEGVEGHAIVVARIREIDADNDLRKIWKASADDMPSVNSLLQPSVLPIVATPVVSGS